MQDDSLLDQRVKHMLEETWAVFSLGVETANPALLFSRLLDLTRSNAFLWAETGLQLQERAARVVPVGQSLSRSLVLVTAATDIYMGYTMLRERAKWAPSLVKPRDWALQHQRSAHRILETAASLGGALIKACQFASTRPDLLPSDYTHTLAPLQDHMPPRPWSEIEAQISKELGRPLKEVFARVEPEAIAAASIAQVHRARLLDGREVALKVQYQDIERLVALDLTVLEQIATAIGYLLPSIQLQPIVEYLKETLPLELDFKHEAKQMAALRSAFSRRADVVVPAVITELSTQRLLVMEFIEGEKITNLEALEEAGISLQDVARLLNDVYAEQMLRLGILHADPHPGNLLVQPGPKLVLLDHGLTVALTPTLSAALRKMVQALSVGDFEALTLALSEAGLIFEGETDLATLLQLVGVLLGKSEDDQGDAVNVASFGRQFGKSIGKIPVDLLLIGRALGLLDGITRQLYPELDTMQVIAQYSADFAG